MFLFWPVVATCILLYIINIGENISALLYNIVSESVLIKHAQFWWHKRFSNISDKVDLLSNTWYNVFKFFTQRVWQSFSLGRCMNASSSIDAICCIVYCLCSPQMLLWYIPALFHLALPCFCYSPFCLVLDRGGIHAICLRGQIDGEGWNQRALKPIWAPLHQWKGPVKGKRIGWVWGECMM